MGKRSLEKATGLTYEERVKQAKERKAEAERQAQERAARELAAFGKLLLGAAVSHARMPYQCTVCKRTFGILGAPPRSCPNCGSIDTVKAMRRDLSWANGRHK